MCAARLDTLLIKVSSRCNLNCSYCYVYNKGDEGWKEQPKLLQPATISQIALRLREQSEIQSTGFPVVLHGGEPLLLGKSRFAQLLDSLRVALPLSCPIALQTNGTLLDHEFIDICAEFSARISISLDGPAAIHDRYRTDFRGRGSHAGVIKGLAALRKHPRGHDLFSGTLTVIDPTTSPATTYSYLKSLGTPSMDFLFQDGNHSRFPWGKKSFESTEYGEWLSGLFECYVVDDTPPVIRILDDYMRLLLGGSSIKEGLGDNDYNILIADTDGTLKKNDTLKSTADKADCFTANWNVFEHSFRDILTSPEFEKYQQLQKPASLECQNCSRVKICGGGMPLFRWKDGSGFDNPSVYCNDHKLVIDHMMERLRDFTPNAF